MWCRDGRIAGIEALAEAKFWLGETWLGGTGYTSNELGNASNAKADWGGLGKLCG